MAQQSPTAVDLVEGQRYGSKSLAEDAGLTLEPAPDEQPVSGDAMKLEPVGATDGSASVRQPSKKHWRWNIHWQDGVNFSLEHDLQEWRWGVLVRKSRTEKFSGKIGMRLELDAAAFLPSQSLDFLEPGVALRRLRLYSKGEFPVFIPIYYKVDVGLVEDEFQLQDIYFWLKEIPWIDTFKFGHFKTPMTLAGYGSSRDTIGMETGSPVEAFAPGIKLGVQLGKAGQANRFSWAVGYFTDGDRIELGDASDSKGRMVGRITGLPLYQDEEGDKFRLVHVGLSSSYVFSKLDNVRYRSRPESFLAGYLADTGDLGAAERAVISGAEFAWVNGPLSVQAEYLFSDVLSQAGQRFTFDGFYAMVSWFPTGEHRPYRKDIGTFDQLTPRRQFSLFHGGVGAVELFGRFSYLDLNDGMVDGGRMSILSTGVNWYWSRNIKIRFNYNYADVEGGLTPGFTHIFQTRLQFSY